MANVGYVGYVGFFLKIFKNKYLYIEIKLIECRIFSYISYISYIVD